MPSSLVHSLLLLYFLERRLLDSLTDAYEVVFLYILIFLIILCTLILTTVNPYSILSLTDRIFWMTLKATSHFALFLLFIQSL